MNCSKYWALYFPHCKVPNHFYTFRFTHVAALDFVRAPLMRGNPVYFLVSLFLILFAAMAIDSHVTLHIFTQKKLIKHLSNDI